MPHDLAWVGGGSLFAFCVALGVAIQQHTLNLLLNTLLYAGGSALASLLLGLPLALLLQRTAIPERRFLTSCCIFMLLLPPFLQAAGWEAGFGLQGWFCRWCFPDQPVAILAGWRGAIAVQTMVNLPWVIFLLSNALTAIPSTWEERALLDGSPWHVLRRVTVPQILPSILAAALWVFVVAAGDITITDIYQIRTFAEEIYTGFALGDGLEQARGRNLAGTLLIVGLGGLTYCSAAILAPQWSNHQHGGAPPGKIPLVPASSLLSVIAILARGAFLFWLAVPVMNLLHQAGMEVNSVAGVRVRNWSLEKAIRLTVTSPQAFAHEYSWSFLLAQLVALTLLPLQVCLAWWGRNRPWVRALCWFSAVTALAIPGPVIALTISRWVSESGSALLFMLYDRTLFVAWLALAIRIHPIAYFMLDTLLTPLAREPEELARLAGASRWQLGRYVVWPAIRARLPGIYLVLLVLAVGDLSTTILALPPGITTLSVRIFNLVHYGVTDQLAGLCLASLALFGLLTFVLGSSSPRCAGDAASPAHRTRGPRANGV